MKKKLKSKALAILMPVLILAMAAVFMICGTEKASAEDEGMYVPLTVSNGFNVDAIYELDGDYSEGIDNTDYDWAYFALPGVTGSLPEDGLIKLGDKKYFKLGDYAAKNVLKIHKYGDKEGTLALSGSEKCRSLIFLMTGGNSGGTVDATVKFSDDTSYKAEGLEVPDWYIGDKDSSEVYRCGRYSKWEGIDLDHDYVDSFGLFEYKIDIPEGDQDKVVTGVTFDNATFKYDYSTICIFGVSGVRSTAEKTVMFDSNGGTCDTTSVTGAPGTIIKLPAATKAGSAFLGWSDGTKTYAANTNYTISEDVVLTAQWGERDYIWLHPNYDGKPEYKHYKNEDGTWPDPTREEYRFTGYYDENDEKVESENLEPGVHYYAEWEYDSTRIDLWVQGVQVTKTNCNDVLSGDPKNKGKVKYDFDTNTLTLNGADLYSVDGPSDSGAVLYDESKLKKDFTIKLVGKNKIEDTTASVYCQGICVNENDLIIEGTGSLEIEQETTDDQSTDSTYAIYSSNGLTIKSDIKINGNAKSYYVGIRAEKLSITGSTVDVSTETTGSNVNGIKFEGAVFEKANIKIDAKGNTDKSCGMKNASDYSSVSSVEVKGSSLDIKCDSVGGTATGIYSEAEMSVSGDSVVKAVGDTGVDLDGNTLNVAAGSTFEAVGADRAMYNSKITEETKVLGAKVKTDPEGEYVPWDGTTDLDDESFTAVYIPGNKVEHVKRAEPTCSKEGNIEYWTVTAGDVTTCYKSEIVSEENKIGQEETVLPADPNAHKYNVKYTWSGDNKTVTAKAVCEHNASHTAEETTNTTSKTTKKATAKAKGEVTYTATFKNPVFKTQTKKVATPKLLKTLNLNVKTVSAKTLDAAVKKAGGSKDSVTTIVLGKKVKKISKGAFKKYKKAKTLVVKTKKLKKSKVKKSLKGSKITKIKVKVGKKKVNKKYVKKYKKIFTKKNAGKKVKVTL